MVIKELGSVLFKLLIAEANADLIESTLQVLHRNFAVAIVVVKTNCFQKRSAVPGELQ